ncbi:MAG: hypothetical protein KTR25_03835 [Myxococcales bacterium]|nr:hypothetical protein [Myxococcales bacterium]
MSGSKKDAPSPPTTRTQTLRHQAWNLGQLLAALGRRPLVWLGGTLLCGLALLLEAAIGQSGEALFNLASYVPFLGGGWAVLAFSTTNPAHVLGHFPSRQQALKFIAAAFVVLMLSGLARITLTIIGELAIKTALALGPTVALADQTWPPASLWRGLMVIDDQPRAFARLVLISAGILLLTVLAVPTGLNLMLGTSGGGLFVQGMARGLGWAIISGLWMRFYLRLRVPA